MKIRYANIALCKPMLHSPVCLIKKNHLYFAQSIMQKYQEYINYDLGVLTLVLLQPQEKDAEALTIESTLVRYLSIYNDMRRYETILFEQKRLQLETVIDSLTNQLSFYNQHVSASYTQLMETMKTPQNPKQEIKIMRKLESTQNLLTKRMDHYVLQMNAQSVFQSISKPFEMMLNQLYKDTEFNDYKKIWQRSISAYRTRTKTSVVYTRPIQIELAEKNYLISQLHNLHEDTQNQLIQLMANHFFYSQKKVNETTLIQAISAMKSQTWSLFKAQLGQWQNYLIFTQREKESEKAAQAISELIKQIQITDVSSYENETYQELYTLIHRITISNEQLNEYQKLHEVRYLPQIEQVREYLHQAYQQIETVWHKTVIANSSEMKHAVKASQTWLSAKYFEQYDQMTEFVHDWTMVKLIREAMDTEHQQHSHLLKTMEEAKEITHDLELLEEMIDKQEKRNLFYEWFKSHQYFDDAQLFKLIRHTATESENVSLTEALSKQLFNQDSRVYLTLLNDEQYLNVLQTLYHQLLQQLSYETQQQDIQELLSEEELQTLTLNRVQLDTFEESYGAMEQKYAFFTWFEQFSEASKLRIVNALRHSDHQFSQLLESFGVETTQQLAWNEIAEVLTYTDHQQWRSWIHSISEYFTASLHDHQQTRKHNESVKIEKQLHERHQFLEWLYASDQFVREQLFRRIKDHSLLETEAEKQYEMIETLSSARWEQWHKEQQQFEQMLDWLSFFYRYDDTTLRFSKKQELLYHLQETENVYITHALNNLLEQHKLTSISEAYGLSATRMKAEEWREVIAYLDEAQWHSFYNELSETVKQQYQLNSKQLMADLILHENSEMITYWLNTNENSETHKWHQLLESMQVLSRIDAMNHEQRSAELDNLYSEYDHLELYRIHQQRFTSAYDQDQSIQLHERILKQLSQTQTTSNYLQVHGITLYDENTYADRHIFYRNQRSALSELFHTMTPYEFEKIFHDFEIHKTVNEQSNRYFTEPETNSYLNFSWQRTEETSYHRRYDHWIGMHELISSTLLRYEQSEEVQYHQMQTVLNNETNTQHYENASLVMIQPQPKKIEPAPTTVQLETMLEEQIQKELKDVSFVNHQKEVHDTHAHVREEVEQLEKKLRLQELQIRELTENQRHVLNTVSAQEITRKVLEQLNAQIRLERLRHGFD